MRFTATWIASRTIVAALVLVLAIPASAKWKERVLYSFQGGADGQTPTGGVVFDKAGNLYGVTSAGGATSCHSSISECGTVFQLSPPAEKNGSWTETVLHVFKGNAGNDGAQPEGGLVIDSSGHLYGTTGYGGTGICWLLGSLTGCGTVFELYPPTQKGGAWTERVLYSFQGGKDGYVPSGDLVLDRAGNLYGVTLFGGGKGTSCDPFYQYCGTVFILNPPKKKGGKWTEKVLHSFAGVATDQQSGDGANPNGSLVLDEKGVIYGTTFYGGNNQGVCDGGSWGTGCGTVFKLNPSRKNKQWQEKILYEFQGGRDGATPAAGVVLGEQDQLYGSAEAGGLRGNGTLFSLRSGQNNWVENTIHVFTDDKDGASPAAGLIKNSDGFLYGSTTTDSHSRGGIVFSVSPPNKKGQWTLSPLHGFKGSPDGATPTTRLVLYSGAFFSTTQIGGGGTGCRSGCGTVFQLTP
jgi:hypothetical protein